MMENQIDYQKQLDDYLMKKLKEQNAPAYGAADRAEMGRIEQNNSDNTLAASLMKSAAQIGSIGGKVADSSAVDNMAQGLGKTNQLKLGQIDDRRAREDKQFGMNADVYKYLAEKQRKNEELAATKDFRAKTLSQNAATAAQKRADDERKFQAERGDKIKDFSLKDKELSLKEGEILAKNAAKDPANLTYDQRMAKLGSEERKRLDSASMGYRAIKDMTDALIGKDENTFSLVGDNNYTMARTKFEEALGRMQSGGAINADEEARFRKMAPTALDSAEIQRKKLADLRTEMGLRVKNMGFEPDEVEAQRELMAKDPVVGGSETAIAGQDKVDPKISEYAKANKITYGEAQGILVGRGYKPNEQ